MNKRKITVKKNKNQNNSLVNNENKSFMYKILIGFSAGICNGLFGGGGGMIIVPMLNFILKYESKKAHATAILIILPLSIVSGLLYLSFGVARVDTFLPTTVGVVLGGVLGAFLLNKLSNNVTMLVFAVAMAGVGIRLAFF